LEGVIPSYGVAMVPIPDNGTKSPLAVAIYLDRLGDVIYD